MKTASHTRNCSPWSSSSRKAEEECKSKGKGNCVRWNITAEIVLVTSTVVGRMQGHVKVNVTQDFARAEAEDWT